VTSVLTTIWVALVGLRLWAMGNRQPGATGLTTP
jgi:hypothetical protein